MKLYIKEKWEKLNPQVQYLFLGFIGGLSLLITHQFLKPTEAKAQVGAQLVTDIENIAQATVTAQTLKDLKAFQENIQKAKEAYEWLEQMENFGTLVTDLDEVINAYENVKILYSTYGDDNLTPQDAEVFHQIDKYIAQAKSNFQLATSNQEMTPFERLEMINKAISYLRDAKTYINGLRSKFKSKELEDFRNNQINRSIQDLDGFREIETCIN